MRFLFGGSQWVKGKGGSVRLDSVWLGFRVGLVWCGLWQRRQQRCGCRLMEFRSCIKCDTQREAANWNAAHPLRTHPAHTAHPAHTPSR